MIIVTNPCFQSACQHSCNNLSLMSRRVAGMEPGLLCFNENTEGGSRQVDLTVISELTFPIITAE